ncbi:MAG: hypothetical protein QM655_14935 [Nocardioidaceae bacterium]
MSKPTIEELIRSEAEHAEERRAAARPDEPLPEGTKVTRGHFRSKTLQVRLNADEYEALESLAKSRELPVSTVARSLLLSALAPSDDAGAVLTRIENELGSLRRALSRA